MASNDVAERNRKREAAGLHPICVHGHEIGTTCRSTPCFHHGSKAGAY